MLIDQKQEFGAQFKLFWGFLNTTQHQNYIYRVKNIHIISKLMSGAKSLKMPLNLPCPNCVYDRTSKRKKP